MLNVIRRLALSKTDGNCDAYLQRNDHRSSLPDFLRDFSMNLGPVTLPQEGGADTQGLGLGSCEGT